MSADLDTRLRELADLSPPSHGPLGADELHQRATRIQRRALAARAIPAAVIVVVLLAGAVALQNRVSTTDVLVGPPDSSEANDGSAISERDRQGLDFLLATTDLRHQLEREMVLTAVVQGSSYQRGQAELAAQRAATDVALRAYTDQATAMSATADGDLPELAEAMKQAENRVQRLGVTRTAADTSQSDALGLIDAYANTTAALQDTTLKFVVGVDDPDVFRGVLTASNLGTVTQSTARTAAILTVTVETRFYAEVLPKGTNPVILRGTCDPDPSSAGNACPVYDLALDSNNDTDQLELSFFTFATAEQKALYRSADPASAYDQMKAAAFEDGAGINDLTGSTPGSMAIDPAEWEAVALARIDRFAAVERQLYESVLTGAPDDTELHDDPVTTFGPGPTVPAPDPPSTATTSSSEAPTVGTEPR